MGSNSHILFGAGMGGLWYLLIFIGISAITNWLQSRQERRKQAQSQPRPNDGQSVEPQAESKKFDWEGELRRLLDVEPVEKDKPIQPAPAVPPLQPELPAPAVPRTHVPTVVREKPRPMIVEEREGPDVDLSSLEESQAATRRARQASEAAERRLASARAMQEASARYDSAASLELQIQARLNHIESRTEKPTAAPRLQVARQRAKAQSPVTAWVRQPATMRHVVLASTVLGLPKALDPNPSPWVAR